MTRVAIALALLALAGCAGADGGGADGEPPAPARRVGSAQPWAIAFVRDGSLALRSSDGAAHPIVRGSVFRRIADRSPAFSPDGRSIAFVSDRGERPQDDLYVLPAGGGEPKRLTNDIRVELDPAWRDDRRIVFVSCALDFGECELAQVSTAGAREILRADVDGPIEIALGADGRLVYAGGDPAGIALDLFAGTLRAGGGRRLAATEAREHQPAVAGDGRIAYARDAGGPGSPRDIYVLPAGGGEPRRLTNDPADDSAPSWSPDGERIAWVRQGAEDSELWVMNADGTCAQALTDNAQSDAQPVWDPRRAPGPLRC